MPKISISPQGYYLIGGQSYTRITTIVDSIVKRDIDTWRSRVGDEEADRVTREALNFGTLLHELTAYEDLGQSPKADEIIKDHPSLIPLLLVWKEWSEQYIKEWVAIEEVVWSKKLRCAGRVDRIGIIKGDRYPSIIDLKTGSLRDIIGIQLAGYELCWKEMEKGRRIQGRIAVNLPRKDPGKLRIKRYDGPEYIKEFKRVAKEFNEMRFQK